MLLLLLATVAPAPMPSSGGHLSPPEAAARLSRCGLGPVTTHFDADLQEDVLSADSARSVSDDQLACAFAVTGHYYFLRLPPDVQPRFDALLEASAGAGMMAEARAWLAARGLLDRVPVYQRGVTDDRAFTRQVETLCGPRAKGAFEYRYGSYSLRPAWMKREMASSGLGGEAMECLMRVTSAAGFKMGFIGNEAYQR